MVARTFHRDDMSINCIAISFIFILLIVLLLCTAAKATTIESTFSCQSPKNGTMTSYSYLKDPELQHSSYSRGYKTGSLNYLVDGNISFYDNIYYVPVPNNDSSVDHIQRVEFYGEKGISEFYAKGFFPNNRAISAWKKIRYDDLNYSIYSDTINLSRSSRFVGRGDPKVNGSYKLEESYKSTYIKVDAEASMGPNSDSKGYRFIYDASVMDGVVEIRDATGWSNETGSRRVDWERDVLMKGDFNITNTLIGEGLFITAGGLYEDGDWLSCCIGGTPPIILDENDSDPGWPNTGTYATLKPDQILPQTSKTPSPGCTQNCSQECLISLLKITQDCIAECSRNCTQSDAENCTQACINMCKLDDSTTRNILEICIDNCTEEKCYGIDCDENHCPNFECILTYPKAFGYLDESIDGKEDLYGNGIISIPTEHLKELGDPSVRIEKTIKDMDDEFVTYRINVTNNGEFDLHNVTLVDVLPDGMRPLSSTVSSPDDPTKERIVHNETYRNRSEVDTVEYNVTWDLGVIKRQDIDENTFKPIAVGRVSILLVATNVSENANPRENRAIVYSYYEVPSSKTLIALPPRSANTTG